MCVDMREANKAIGKEKHPMPTVDDLIADLNNSTVFSKLDLTNANHRLELEESSRYITTFSQTSGKKGAKLNGGKCKFSVNKLTFFGHVFNDKGISVDPGKSNPLLTLTHPRMLQKYDHFWV